MISEKLINTVKSIQKTCDVTGKIGGISFYKWKGQNVYRRIGKPNKPPTPAQLECRNKFRVLQNLSKTFQPIIRETLKNKKITPANLFISKNRDLFKFENGYKPAENPDQNIISQTHLKENNPNTFHSVDYSKLKLTRSNSPIPLQIKLIKHSEKLFTLKWDKFSKRYDTIVFITYSPKTGKYFKTEILINDSFWHIEIPEEFQNTNLYHYLYCYHSKRKTYSDTINIITEDSANILWQKYKQKKSLTHTFISSPKKIKILRFNLLFSLGYLLPNTNHIFYQTKKGKPKIPQNTS